MKKFFVMMILAVLVISFVGTVAVQAAKVVKCPVPPPCRTDGVTFCCYEYVVEHNQCVLVETCWQE